MTQVNHSKSDVMITYEIDILAFKTYQQGSEFVNPGKRTFAGKAMLVDGRVEETLATAFGMLAVALVFSNVGNEAMIETHFARCSGIKSFIGIEESALKMKTQMLHELEGSL